MVSSTHGAVRAGVHWAAKLGFVRPSITRPQPLLGIPEAEVATTAAHRNAGPELSLDLEDVRDLRVDGLWGQDLLDVPLEQGRRVRFVGVRRDERGALSPSDLHPGGGCPRDLLELSDHAPPRRRRQGEAADLDPSLLHDGALGADGLGDRIATDEDRAHHDENNDRRGPSRLPADRPGGVRSRWDARGRLAHGAAVNHGPGVAFNVSPPAATL